MSKRPYPFILWRVAVAMLPMLVLIVVELVANALRWTAELAQIAAEHISDFTDDASRVLHAWAKKKGQP